MHHSSPQIISFLFTCSVGRIGAFESKDENVVNSMQIDPLDRFFFVFIRRGNASRPFDFQHGPLEFDGAGGRR